MACSPSDWHCAVFAGCCLLPSRMQWKCQPGEDATRCRRWTRPSVKSSWWDIPRKSWVFPWVLSVCIESLGDSRSTLSKPPCLLCVSARERMQADSPPSRLFRGTHSSPPFPGPPELGWLSGESGERQLLHPVSWETRHKFSHLRQWQSETEKWFTKGDLRADLMIRIPAAVDLQLRPLRTGT